MFVNYGDKNFFEDGFLLDMDHSDTEFQAIVCIPLPDMEDSYLFAECIIDITDSWIEKPAVMAYCGMNDENFDKAWYARACIEYYGVENFNGGYTEIKTKAQICEILRQRAIASDNLDID